MSNYRRDHHYVAKSYLRRWAPDGVHVQAYRTLVADAGERLWKLRSITGLAYVEHLYTRLVNGVATDDFERWLDQQFESPTQEVLRKATNDQPLSRAEWILLVRFMVLQELRTPARFVKELRRMERDTRAIIENCLKEFSLRLEAGEYSNVKDREPRSPHPHQEYLPYRVQIEDTLDPTKQALVVETVPGRGQWLFGIKHIMEHSDVVNVLFSYDWTILAPPEGQTWFTSDDPVTKVQFTPDGRCDFSAGWGTPGVRMMFPLGPHHLLYTQVGEASPPPGSGVTQFEAELFRHAMARNASRWIFADSEIADILQLRPRVVSRQAVEEERESWKRWNENQTKAERDVMGF
jgi:hypothetical protein